MVLFIPILLLLTYSVMVMSSPFCGSMRATQPLGTVLMPSGAGSPDWASCNLIAHVKKKCVKLLKGS